MAPDVAGAADLRCGLPRRLEGAVYYAGAGRGGTVVVGLLIALLIGIEAGTLRRFTLARRGWKNVGVVSAYDLEDAERRFFADWVRAAPTVRGAPAAPPPEFAAAAATAAYAAVA